MKRILTLVGLLLTLCASAQPGATGTPYDDAIKFYNALYKPTSKDEALAVIAYYFDTLGVNQSNAAAILSQNPFLAKYAANFTEDKFAGNPNGLPSSGVASGIMGLDVSKYADGLAKFLIERGRQELSMAFFSRFRDDLKKYPELRLLFVKSVAIINTIESHNANSVLQELRDAFIKDLLNMPDNILSLRSVNVTEECHDDKNCTARMQAIRNVLNGTDGSPNDPRAFTVPLLIAQGIVDGNNITENLNRIVTDQSVCGKNDDLSGVLKVTALLLESLRSGDGTETGLFINQNKFKNLVSSEDIFRIFLGLVYEKYQAPTYQCFANLQLGQYQGLRPVFNQLLTERNRFYSLVASFDKVNISYYALKRQLLNGNKPDASYLASISSASISTVSSFVETLEKLLALPGAPNRPVLLANLYIASDLCTDIQQRNYTGIFNNVLRILDQNKLVTDTKARQRVVKYLSFAANLASASNSDEIKDAINSVALPPGSYSLKQKSANTIALNAYIGYSWDLNGGLYAHGVYAPLGFTFSAGLSRRFGGSVSLFTSVIDVGALASYRLHNSPTDTLKQQVRLESIVSPSVQIVLGIPKVPLAVCLGWRSTPKLFYATKDDSFLTVPSRSTFNLGILIDIPVATIFNKPYN